MSCSEVTALLGEEAEVATFTSAEQNGDDIHVKFTRTDAVNANEPCLVYVGSDVTVSRTLKNKTLEPVANPSTAGTALCFVGTYEAYASGKSPLTTDDYVLSTAETFKHATSGHAIKAYRAYLKANAGSNVKANVIQFSVNEATGIETIINRQQGNSVYDISGRRTYVHSYPSVRPVLPKGLYISGGKKFLTK